jgi:hypothetical protein
MPELTNDGRMKGRQKGGDQTIEDAFKTMERFVLWLQTAQRDNVWQTLDPLQSAMLFRFLDKLAGEIGSLVALGGDDARNAVELFQLMGNAAAQAAPPDEHADADSAAQAER